MPDDNTATPTNQSTVPTAPPAFPSSVSTPSDSSAPASAPAPAEPTTPPASSEPAASPDETAVPSADDTIVDPTVLPDVPAKEKSAPSSAREAVVEKIAEAHNVLIALSSDPSVDEMAAAIGLSLFLDKLGKRATAIYSGATPNALEFLKPEETFEPTADTLQDFVIAINKDKADHLRYKLDGDFVKIFVTPYKTRITEEDFEFSYGDYNVDLVIALDVANGIDLDSALREHGRIMHDAVIINVTTSKPGKFGEIEWSDKTASSVSEMIASLLFSIKGDFKIEKDEATAFLTGIVAATNRFSNATTTPETMRIASKLMDCGANQQLVSKNITSDIENEFYALAAKQKPKADQDPTKLDIEHDGEKNVDESKEVNATVTEKESTLLEDLKAAEASLAQAGAETTNPESSHTFKIENGAEVAEPASLNTPDISTPDLAPASESGSSDEPKASETLDTPKMVIEPPAGLETPETPKVSEAPEVPETPDDSETSKAPEEPEEPEKPVLQPTASFETPESSSGAETEEANVDSASPDDTIDNPEKVLQPSAELNKDLASGNLEADQNKYGQMLEDALKSADGTPDIPTFPEGNPATASTPSVPDNPEINGVPEMNYMPMPGEEVLPPPPTPPIDMSGSSISDSMPSSTPEPINQPIEPTTSASEPAPAEPQPVASSSSASDPAAFKIPGM